MMTDEEWERFERRKRLNWFAPQYDKAKVRWDLFDAQEGICAICGELILQVVSIDHVIPKSMGGQDMPGNLVATHMRCNGDKSNNPPCGCQLIWLLSVNARLGVQPTRW